MEILGIKKIGITLTHALSEGAEGTFPLFSCLTFGFVTLQAQQLVECRQWMQIWVIMLRCRTPSCLTGDVISSHSTLTPESSHSLVHWIMKRYASR